MSMGKPISMDKERVSFNVSRLRKGGKVFEVGIDPDKAISLRKGADIDLKDVLKGEHIFSDAKRGVLASEADMKTIFGTSNPLNVASIILKEGEIQLTIEYRDKIREEKKRRILEMIHRDALDPRTKLPHPMVRIENAFEQAKCKIDEFKTAEEQIDDVLNKLRKIIPIKIEQIVMQIHVPSQNAHQAYGTLKRLGNLKQEIWDGDGSLVVKLEIPAGLQEEVINTMNSLTHGGVDIKILD